MTKSNSTLTAERLRELLYYDPETGVFTRLISISNSPVGRVAGTQTHNGYKKISVNGKIYFSHRLAWLYVHGVWPKEQIDHIDGDRLNNRLGNLREATAAQNSQNLHDARSDNKAGLIGAHRNNQKNCWFSQIKDGNKNRYLGSYATAQDAHNAYLIAKSELHEFSQLHRPCGEIYLPRIRSSEFDGVYWCKRSNRWLASIKVLGRTKHIGYFLDELEAHQAVLSYQLAHSGAKLRTDTRRHFELSQDEINGELSEYERDAAKRRGWM